MAPSKKGAKTQTQVVHHDEDDLIQVRDRDEVQSIRDDDAIDGMRSIASRPEMDDGRHRAERCAMMGR